MCPKKFRSLRRDQNHLIWNTPEEHTSGLLDRARNSQQVRGDVTAN